MLLVLLVHGVKRSSTEAESNELGIELSSARVSQICAPYLGTERTVTERFVDETRIRPGESRLREE